MAASLTGFGRSEATDAKGRVCAEMKSVNNRFLQIDLHIPYGFGWIDAPLRSFISESVFRGKVILHLEVTDYTPSLNIVINRPLLGKLIELQGDLESETGRKVNVSLDGLLALPGVMKSENSEFDQQALWERIKPVVEKALKAFIEFRRREGEKLTDDLILRKDRLCEYLKVIEARIPVFREKFMERFSARIKELAGKADFDESRLSTEIAIWADRSDVSEEVVRFKSHLGELNNILNSTGPVGRKLDFLLQEMNREANTLNNKIGDLLVIQQALEIKCELEKIREQVQNLE